MTTRKWIIVLGIACLAVAAGCKRTGEVPEEPTVYDPELDGSVAAISTVRTDPADLEPGSSVPYVVETPSGGTGDTGGGFQRQPAPDTGDPVEDVKIIYGRMIDAAKANNWEAVASYLDKPEATVFLMLKGIENLPSKANRLEQLIQEKGIEPPQDFKDDLSKMPNSDQLRELNVLQELANERVSDLEFRQDGSTVRVFDEDGQPEADFVKVNGQWKQRMPSDMRGLAITMVGAIGAMNQVTNDLVAGIENGSITKDNFETRFEEIFRRSKDKVNSVVQGIGGGASMPDMGDDDDGGGPIRRPGDDEDDDDDGQMTDDDDDDTVLDTAPPEDDTDTDDDQDDTDDDSDSGDAWWRPDVEE